MTSLRSPVLPGVALFAFVLLSANACSQPAEESDDDDALGGSATGAVSGAGVIGGSAGAPSSGGTATGGTMPSVGGAAATAGASVGGAAGTATGGTVTGGSSGAAGAGATATGGAAGAGGSGTAILAWNFDSGLDGWTILTGAGASTPETLSTTSMLAHAAADGDPMPGSLEFSIPFDAVSEKVSVSIGTPATDLTGKTISARVKLVSGLTADGANPGGVKVFAKSGATMYIYGEGTRLNLGPAELGMWLTATFPLATPAYMDAGFDAAQVVQIGIQIDTGGTGTFSAAVLHIDSISVQ